MTLTELLQQKLASKQFSSDEFSELLIRLLDYGVICRDESQVEEQLYDRHLQLQDLVEDYLAPCGCVSSMIADSISCGCFRLAPRCPDCRMTSISRSTVVCGRP